MFISQSRMSYKSYHTIILSSPLFSRKKTDCITLQQNASNKYINHLHTLTFCNNEIYRGASNEMNSLSITIIRVLTDLVYLIILLFLPSIYKCIISLSQSVFSLSFSLSVYIVFKQITPHTVELRANIGLVFDIASSRKNVHLILHAARKLRMLCWFQCIWCLIFS